MEQRVINGKKLEKHGNKAVVAATSEGRYWRLSIGPEKSHKQTWALKKKKFTELTTTFPKHGDQKSSKTEGKRVVNLKVLTFWVLCRLQGGSNDRSMLQARSGWTKSYCRRGAGL